MYLDPHCHLDLPAFDADRAAVLARARAVGVGGWIVAGVDPAGWQRQRQLALQEPTLWWTAGLHPVAVAEGADVRVGLDGLAAQFTGHRPAIAVGETGLDRRRQYRASIPDQERAFRAQLALARTLDVPVVLHVVAAHGRVLELLRADGLPKRGGMMHAWSGSAELVPAFVELGLYLSLPGPVVQPNARKMRASAQCIPTDRLLVETDAPDLSPVPGRNEPAHLPHIAAAVAALRGVEPSAVLAQSTANAMRLFGIKMPPA